MKFKQYINETKIGKLPGKVTRIAHGGDPFELEIHNYWEDFFYNNPNINK